MKFVLRLTVLPRLGALALAAAVLGALLLPVARVGKYLAMGLAILALGTGFLGNRCAQASSRCRLAGCAGMAIGFLVLALGLAQFALTLYALERMASLFSVD